MSRQFTKEEIRNQFLEHIRLMVGYWSGPAVEGLSVADRCDGVAFSILTMIDGSANLPPFEISAVSSEEDKSFFIESGDNYYPLSQVINDDVMLHELFTQVPAISFETRPTDAKSDDQS